MKKLSYVLSLLLSSACLSTFVQADFEHEIEGFNYNTYRSKDPWGINLDKVKERRKNNKDLSALDPLLKYQSMKANKNQSFLGGNKLMHDLFERVIDPTYQKQKKKVMTIFHVDEEQLEKLPP